MKTQKDRDSQRVTAAMDFLIENFKSQPSLAQVADQVHLSRFHFQRMFRQWVGVSPKQFAQYLSIEYAKKVLKETHATLFDAACEIGLSTPSRLHDLFVKIEGMTPGEYKNGGESLLIRYSFGRTPFGTVLIGSTEKGICHLSFTDQGESAAVQRMKYSLPRATYRLSAVSCHEKVLSFFNQDWKNPEQLKLHLKGSDFQLKIWKTLLEIPPAGLASYSGLAEKAGYPRAHRAVGTALGCNPVAVLIPCHRVIQSSGIIGSYQYGEVRKNAIIGWEAAKF